MDPLEDPDSSSGGGGSYSPARVPQSGQVGLFLGDRVGVMTGLQRAPIFKEFREK